MSALGSSINFVNQTTVVPVNWFQDVNNAIYENEGPIIFNTNPSSGNVYADPFVGNGTQTVFNTSAVPGSLASLHISVGGLVQLPTTDYTWSVGTTTITFVTAPPNGQPILIQYPLALPVGTVDSGNAAFTATGNYPAGSAGKALQARAISVTDAPYNADPTGVADFSTAIQNALTQLQSNGGGTLIIPKGTYSQATGAIYDCKYGSIRIIADGATITYSGTGVGLTLTNSLGGGGAAIYRPIIEAGLWIGSSTGTCIRVLDCSRAQIQGAWVSSGTGTCVELRNYASYCEQTVITGCVLVGGTALITNPASVTGGTGTGSFARTRVTDTIISGGISGQWLVILNGQVYDSSFLNLGGNLNAGANGFYFNGSHEGTVVQTLGFEGGNSSSVLLGQGPNLAASVHPIFANIDSLAPITTTNSVWTYPYRIWGTSLMVGPSTIPANGVLRLSGPGTIRCMSSDGLRELEMFRAIQPSGTLDQLAIGGFTTWADGILLAQNTTCSGVFSATNGLVVPAGPTSSRPASPAPYYHYFDTTIEKPIWYSYANGRWQDATGAAA